MRNVQERGDPEICDAKEFKNFQLRWIELLNNKSPAWEGPRAMDELKPLNIRGLTAWKFLCDKSNWRQTELFVRIFLEVDAYHREKRKLFSQDSRGLLILFTKLAEKLHEHKETVQNRKLKAIVATVENEIRIGLSELRRVMDAHSASRSPLTIYEDFYPDHPRRRLMQRRIDLDTRLQIQLAKMFTLYLEEYNVSRLTLARLVVLTYVVPELAAEHPSDGTLQVLGTGRVLSARNVQDKIVGLRKRFDLNPKKQVSGKEKNNTKMPKLAKPQK